MVRNAAYRSNFVRTSVDFLLKNKFDGLGVIFINIFKLEKKFNPHFVLSPTDVSKISSKSLKTLKLD